MIKLEENIINTIIKECKNELTNKQKISFDNIKDLSNKIPIYSCGIVYFIYSNDELKYIGKSKGKYFSQRMKSHFYGIGKGTKSKHHLIKKDKEEITLKYIKIEPEALRNLIEELLIKYFKTDDKDNGWNQQS